MRLFESLLSSVLDRSQGSQNLAQHFWPLRPPDITPRDYFLWGYVKEDVYVAPLPTTLVDLRNHVTASMHSVTKDTLSRVWDEFDYCLDVR